MPSKSPGRPPSQRPGRDRPIRDGHASGGPNDARYVATHEAGHAVAAILLGLDLRGVDVRRRQLPDGTISLGYTDCPSKLRDVAGRGEEAGLPWLIQALAGPAAESLINPDPIAGGGHADDHAAARRIAVVSICEMEDLGDGRVSYSDAEQRRQAGRMEEFVGLGETLAERLVEDHRAAIERVASLLIQRGSLTGREVDEAVYRTGAGSPA